MAFVGGAIFVGSLIMQEQAQDKAERAQERGLNEQEKSRAVQAAENASKAAAEKRRLLREERVRRANILQSSEGTGVTDSSGQIVALENVASKAGDAIAMNEGALEAAGQMSIFEQNASNFQGEARNHMNDANMWGQVGQAGFSMGMSAAKTPKAPTANPSSSIFDPVSSTSYPNSMSN